MQIPVGEVRVKLWRKEMKKLRYILLLAFIIGISTIAPETAEGYWRHGRMRKRFKRFKPRFALTGSLGLHFVDYYDDLEEPIPPFAFIMSEFGGHLWISPYLSLDLNLAAHLVTSDVAGASWGYISVKPGLRIRINAYYLRFAADLAFSGQSDTDTPQTKRSRVFLFGFLVGAGVRVPISYRFRFFAELDYQFLFTDLIYMPIYGQMGIEYIF